MKKAKGCAKGCFRTVVLLVAISLAVRFLNPSFFSKQTINFYIRYLVLREMFKGPLEDWWGEMVRSALVERRGKVVYAGLGTTMCVFSMDESGKLKLLKKIPLLGFAHGFAQEENTLYVAAGATGLHIFDVSAPENPKFLSRYLTDGYGLGIAVSKGTAYLGDEENGFVVVDARDPKKPREVSHIKKGNVNFVLVKNDIAYLADGGRGVVIYDVKNPAKPKQLGVAHINYTSRPKPIDVPPLGLALSGNYLLVANGERGLEILDVQNPRAPKAVSRLPLNGFSYSVIVDGATAYVADIVNGAMAVDIQNPRAPKILRIIKTPGQAFDVTAWKNKLVVSSGAGGLHMVNKQSSSSQILGSYTESSTTFGVTLDAEKNLLFTANGSGGINIYDMKNPAQPALLSHLDTPGYAHRVKISGNFAYVADVIGGCQVLDIKNPRAPKIIHQFDYQQHPWDVALYKNHAVIADAHHGFTLFDVKNPAGAKFVSNVDLARYTVGVAVEENRAYFADLASFFFSKGGLFIYDISNPSKPEKLGNLSMQALDVAVDNKMVYLAAYKNGLVVADAQNPKEPEISFRYKTRGYVYGVHLEKAEKKLYAADYKKGIFVFDVKNPAHPALEKNYKTRGTAYDALPYKNVLLAADGKEGLTVIDARSGEIIFPEKAHR